MPLLPTPLPSSSPPSIFLPTPLPSSSPPLHSLLPTLYITPHPSIFLPTPLYSSSPPLYIFLLPTPLHIPPPHPSISSSHPLYFSSPPLYIPPPHPSTFSPPQGRHGQAAETNGATLCLSSCFPPVFKVCPHPTQ